MFAARRGVVAQSGGLLTNIQRSLGVVNKNKTRTALPQRAARKTAQQLAVTALSASGLARRACVFYIFSSLHPLETNATGTHTLAVQTCATREAGATTQLVAAPLLTFQGAGAGTFENIKGRRVLHQGRARPSQKSIRRGAGHIAAGPEVLALGRAKHAARYAMEAGPLHADGDGTSSGIAGIFHNG